MPQPPLPPEKEQQVIECLKKGMGRDQTVRATGVSNGKVSEIKARLFQEVGQQEKQTDEYVGDNWNISLPSTRICTLDQLVEHCKIDLGLWEVERFICNKWEVGAKIGEPGKEKLIAEPLFQVKAFLKKKRVIAFARAEIELLRKEALNYSPLFTGFKPRKPAGSGVAVEISIVDHHFGGLIWGEETGGEDWDSKIALDAWKDAGAALMERTDSFRPERALILFGNDQQNADNRQGSTERLTPQQMDGRYQKVFRTSVEASRWMIDQAVARYGRVHVVISPGNHDPLASWHLGYTLEMWYHNLPCVTIDNGPQHRKWWEWGVVMLMFEHGDKGKLANYGKVMASEKPEMWGRTKVHEAHTGHVHHDHVIEDMGFTGRSLPSLRPACSWGSENHHLGAIRAAQAFVWSKTEGLIGQANFSVLRKGEDKAA